jgi:hypothetical protein
MLNTTGMKTQLSPPTPPAATSRYMPAAAVAVEYGIGTRHLKYLRATRRLPFIRAGHRCVLFDRRDLEKFLASRRVEAIGQKSAEG